MSCLASILLLLVAAAHVFTHPAATDGGGQATDLTAAESELHAEFEDSVPAASSLDDVELVAEDEDDAEDAVGEGQHFFPSFAPLFSGPPLGHSRPHSVEFDPPHRASSFQEAPFRYRASSGVPERAPDSVWLDTAGSVPAFPLRKISARPVYRGDNERRSLGSANFGVIKGGTYYGGSNDESDEFDVPYYRGNNGHGRPPYFRGNPQPAYRHGGDFFAGFRDFADITTPAKPAYSQYFVVYANRNSTAPVDPSSPRNIIEQLALLDKKVDEKLSKNKLKLAQYKEKVFQTEYKKKNKSPKDAFEPLLALS